MADDTGAPWANTGLLQSALAAMHARGTANDGVIDASQSGDVPGNAAAVLPGQVPGQPGAPRPVDPRQMAAGALLAGSQSLGARGTQHAQMTPQQQAQLVQMLRARGMQQQGQPPGQPAPGAAMPGQPGMPPPGMPAPGGMPGQMPPILQNAPPLVPGQQ